MHVGIANPLRWGKAFPAFPVHGQSAVLRVWQEAHASQQIFQRQWVSKLKLISSMETLAHNNQALGTKKQVKLKRDLNKVYFRKRFHWSPISPAYFYRPWSYTNCDNIITFEDQNQLVAKYMFKTKFDFKRTITHTVLGKHPLQGQHIGRNWWNVHRSWIFLQLL